MQRVVDGDIQAMVDRLRALSDRQAAEKAHRLSLLPPGTCEHCEGDGCSACTVPAQPCADGIPYEFQAASLKDEAREGQDRAILLARRFVEAPERDVYLYGGVGAGKTRLACAIANAWIVGRKRSALFARVPMLLYQLQPGRDQDSIDDLERRVLTRDLVVLDDIGAERDQATDFTRRTLLML
jgi:hypothetical protein